MVDCGSAETVGKSDGGQKPVLTAINAKAAFKVLDILNNRRGHKAGSIFEIPGSKPFGEEPNFPSRLSQRRAGNQTVRLPG